MNKIPLVDLEAQHNGLRLEIETAVDRVIQATDFIQGAAVQSFEQAFAAYIGNQVICRTCGNGTDALFLALRALGIGPGDEVITTPFTFIATAEAISLVGARPVFVDISKETMLLDPNNVERAITGRTRAIIAVHLYGQPCDMETLTQIGKTHHLFVIEDAAQAHGASWQEKKVGAWGDIACFSFYPGKNLGAYGDAGCVTSSNQAIMLQVKMLSNHGRIDKYEHLIEGVNSRLDAIQAAVLDVKLRHLDEWNRSRQRLAQNYLRAFQDVDYKVQQIEPSAKSVWHLFTLRHPERDRILHVLKEKDIQGGVHYPIPLHLQPALRYLGYQEGDFPIAEHTAQQVFSLPLYPELTPDQQERVIEEVMKFCTQAV